MRRYIEIYSTMLRNSLIREMSFKANFLLWMVVEVLWFCGQIVFFSIIFGQVDHIGDWTKWEVVLLVGTHQMIAQIFQGFFFVNIANIPELVRTGKLDSLLVLPIDSQFAVSTKQFGLDSMINAALGGVGELLDRPGSRARLRIFQFSQYCALAGRDFSENFPIHFRLDYSSRDYRKYSRPPAHQIAWTTRAAYAASCHCLDAYFLAISRLLE